MQSRVDKYFDDNNSKMSRTARNNELYRQISKAELDNYEVKSNATVIGNNTPNIDVDRIKSILDTHYKDAPKRKSIDLRNETSLEQNKKNPIFETKEYDINVIIDKAKEDKEVSYVDERSKKIHDTQYDILSNLNIDKNDYIEDYENDDRKADEKNLQELINTITMNEKNISQEAESKTETDLFADLKASDKSEVLTGLSEKTAAMIDEMKKTSSIDKSFFTKTDAFKDKDFEDFEDIEEDSSVFMKILIIILAIVFIAGIAILVKSFL